MLEQRGLSWTSVRPVYIYGPLNYNPVEEWFFQRLKEGRPIPVPNSGQQVGFVMELRQLTPACVIISNDRSSHWKQMVMVGSFHCRQRNN